MVDMKQVQLRLPDGLAERIDERAGKVELSRNAWLVKAIEWALDQPIRERTVKERV